MLIRAVIFFSTLYILGCSTPAHKALDQVTRGMDKSEVLELAGGPTRTLRKNSVDHWVYVYYVKEQRRAKEVQLKNGKVISVGPYALSKGEAADEKEFRDYKKMMDEKKSGKKQDQNFKSLDD